MITFLLIFIFGAILLYYGAELLIGGSKVVAEKFNISPIIIGITLVAFGTSLPELIVCIFAIIKNDTGIVIGNVIGSNIANIGLVLGFTAIIFPIHYSYKKIKFDLYFLLFISLLPVIFIYFGKLDFIHGLIFILLLIGYCVQLYNSDNISDESYNKINYRFLLIIIKIIIGILGLGYGAHFFVVGAQGIIKVLGITSIAVGMSIVALGTSLPELAASISAARYKQNDLIIGNIIGSNIMNIIAVLGVTLLYKPISIQFQAISSQIIFMLILPSLLLLLLKFKGGVSKNNGMFFLTIYILFLYFNFNL